MDDPVYIKQIIGFVQCLMIAKCICAYLYLSYSKTKKVHIDSRKRLAFFYTIMWRPLCVYIYRNIQQCLHYPQILMGLTKSQDKGMDDPLYIKQIIGFAQCLMIAECICAYLYLSYSKTKKVHIDSRKRLAFFYTIIWRLLYIYRNIQQCHTVRII